MSHFNWPVRVYYEDTDAGGVVYHASYLRFFERARTEWLRAAGFNQSLLHEQNIVFVVSELSIKYVRPARLDAELDVQLNIQAVKKASLQFLQLIYDKQQNLIAQAEVRVACLKADTLKPCAIPPVILTSVTASLEEKSGE
ncbi:MAG: tol-pal system-associated acyl-CoA thioesterase [Oceanospirillaceae bacterium]|nr:tol-pal system-associated acyl-CoA thioesterase [Oceanospirillaceae bacterium]MCP5351016.1 tol-pal system-associated acyl-CoA thioesterase [Oceanospirillaceae bacterium]